MLDTLRRFAKSKGALILIGLLILSFGLFFGISDMVNDRHGGNKLATVGKEHVDMASFQQAFKQTLEQRAVEISKQTGKNVDMQALKEQAIAQGMGQMIVHQLATRLAYTQEAKELGIMPSDDQIKQIIQNLPAFKDEGGQFSRALFDKALQHTGMTEAALVKGFKEDIAQSNLLSALTSTVQIPSETVRAFYAYEQGKRLVSWSLLTADLVPEDQLPSLKEDELKAYYDKNKAHFTVPEHRSLDTLLISLSALKDKHSVSSQDVHAEFERRKHEFETPETRRLTQIIASDKKVADQAADLLAKHKKPEDLPGLLGAGKIQVDRQDTFIPQANMPKKIGSAIFALKEGEVSKPQQMPNGVYLFIVEAVRPKKPAQFDAVSLRIKDDLLTNKAKEDLYELVKKVEDEISAGSTFAEVSKAQGLSVVSYKKVDAQGRLAAGDLAPQLKKPEDHMAVIKAGFAAGEGMESGTIELSTGDMAIVRAESVMPMETLAFDKAKPMVTQLWQYEKRMEVLEKTAKAAVEGKLTPAQEKIMSAATIGTPIVLSRNGQLDLSGKSESKLAAVMKGGQGLPMPAVDRLFQIAPNEVASTHMPYFDEKAQQPMLAFLVGRVKDVIKADMKLLDKHVEDYTRSVTEAFASDVQAFYTLSLHSKFKTKINPALSAPAQAEEE